MLREFFKRPVGHLEFVAPGSILLAVSLFSVTATLLTTKPFSAAVADGYFVAGFVGVLISLLLLYRTKIGTLLYPMLLIPYAYFVYYIVGWRGDSWGMFSASILIVSTTVINTVRQLRYHSNKLARDPRTLCNE